jgi:hypothetical protein
MKMRFVGGNMKTLKQARTLLFVMLAAASILPGCGKSNGSGTAVYGAAGFVPIGSYPGGGSGCTQLTNPNTSATLTFAGTLAANTTSLQANLGLYGINSYTGGYGAQYNRQNMFGDSISIYVSGTSAYAVVTLAQPTVADVVYYNGGNVCGLYINASVIPGGTSGSGWSGNFGGGTIALTQNGTWVVTSTGSIMQL